MSNVVAFYFHCHRHLRGQCGCRGDAAICLCTLDCCSVVLLVQLVSELYFSSVTFYQLYYS